MNKTHSLLGLVAWLLVCFAASFIGALAAINAPEIYGQMTQPSWAPPAWLFGPVWTTLYAMMAVAAWLVWQRGGWRANRLALAVFLLQLALNALWSWLFFAWLQGLWSVINIAVLWLLILTTMVLFLRVNRWAAWLLVPYLAWVSFATALNTAMWQLNPQILG